jgi:D-3-phosphoglycerate dehydrogenase
LELKIKPVILFLEDPSLPRNVIDQKFSNFEIVNPRAGRKIFNNSSITHIYTKLSNRLDEHFLSNFINLKFIGCPTTSIDHIDIDFCNINNIKIFSLSKNKKLLSSITSTSELTSWFILEFARSASSYVSEVAKGNWDRYAIPSNSLNGKTLGVIGLGRIGMQVAKIFTNFGMKIVYFDINKKYFNNFKRASSISKLFELSDFVTIHVNGTLENTNLINREVLRYSKATGVYLINTSRGLVVNEIDIIEGLDSGQLNGYATDVLLNENSVSLKWLHQNPLWLRSVKDKDVIITPHIGGSTIDSLRKVDTYILNLLAKHLKF